MMILAVFIIPIISFIIQVFPRFFNRYYGVDVWMRLIEADLIRQNKHRIPTHLIKKGFILAGYSYYPPVLPWMLSFVPKKTLIEVQGFIAPIFDAIQNIVVFFIAYQLTGNFQIGLLAQFIYALTPIVILENSYLTPRSLGYLIFTLSFYPLILYSVNGNYWYLIFSFVFFTLGYFTHKFEIQSLLFISIFFTFIEQTFLYIGFFMASLVIAMIISRGFYWNILREHIANIIYWSKFRRFRFAHQIRGLTENKRMDLVGIIYKVLNLFSPVSLLGINLWVLGPFVFLVANFLNLTIFPIDNPILLKMSLWVTFFYGFAVLVLSVKYLMPIGEGQRYLEMALVPTAIVSSIIIYSLLQTDQSLWGWGSLLGIVLVNLLVSIFFQWKAVVQDRTRTFTPAMRKACHFLNKIKPRARVMCIPHQITTMVLYNSNADVLVDIQPTKAAELADVFPMITKPIKELSKKYKLNTLVLRKDYASMKELKLSKKSLLFEMDEVQIFKI